MTVTEAAATVGCSQGTIYKFIARGKLSCARIGPGRGRIEVDPRAVEASLAKSRSPFARPKATLGRGA